MPVDTEWAYLAGLIDGEGCIWLGSHNTKSTNSYAYYVSIYNTDGGLIEYLFHVFGGYCHYNERNDRNGDRYGHMPIHRIVWHSKDDIMFILNGVLPYLIVKHAKASALLNFLDIPKYDLIGRKECCKLAKIIQ